MNIELNTNNRAIGGSLLKIMGLLLLSIGFCFHAGAQTLDWAHAISGGGEDNIYGYQALALDAAGNVYIAGAFTDTVDFDPGTGSAPLTDIDGRGAAFLAKYDANGKYLWAKRIMGATSGATGYDVAVDARGDVSVTGTFGGTGYFNTGAGTDSFVTKGSQRSYNDMFLSKYDSDGNYVWAKHISFDSLMLAGNKNVPGRGLGYSMVVDRTGSIYVTGMFDGAADFDPGPKVARITNISNSQTNGGNMFLAKYNADGNYIWAKAVAGGGYSEGLNMVLDTTGNVNNLYITGFWGDTTDFDPGSGNASLVSAGDMDVYIAKYDSSGHYIWAKGMGGPFAEMGIGIAADRMGNVYIGGLFGGTADFDPSADTAMITAQGFGDLFLAKYDAGGNYLWAKDIGGTAAFIQSGGQIALDTLANVYVTGGFLGVVDFDPDSCVATLTPDGLADGFLAKYNTYGNYIWAEDVAKGSANPMSFAFPQLVLDLTGNVYLTGGFSGMVDFDPGPNTTSFTSAATGTYDIFLSKLTLNDTLGAISYLTVSTCAESYTFNGTDYTQSGTYVQSVPGVTHCDSTIILTLKFNSINKPHITTNGFTLGVSGDYATYQWIENNVPVPGATDSTYTVTENGDYRVAVTNDAGCSDTSDVYTVNNYTGIKDLTNLANQIKVYPNPTSDKVYIQSPVPVNITLTDIAGRTIQTVKNAHNMSLENLEAGIYLLQLKNKDGLLISTVKMVKK